MPSNSGGEGRGTRDRSPRRRDRSCTPPAVRPEAAGPLVAWDRDNLELLLANTAEVIKLVEVERLLIAHNHATPAIRRGDVPPFTVLQGLLLAFNWAGRRLGFAARYEVLDGEDRVEIEAGLPDGDPLIPLLSVSSRMPFEGEDWRVYGRAELERLREAYLARHGRGLHVDQAAAVAWRRCVALAWYARYRSEKEGMQRHLRRLLDDLRDRNELQRWARKFEAEPAGEAAGTAAAASAAAATPAMRPHEEGQAERQAEGQAEQRRAEERQMEQRHEQERREVERPRSGAGEAPRGREERRRSDAEERPRSAAEEGKREERPRSGGAEQGRSGGQERQQEERQRASATPPTAASLGPAQQPQQPQQRAQRLPQKEPQQQQQQQQQRTSQQRSGDAQQLQFAAKPSAACPAGFCGLPSRQPGSSAALPAPDAAGPAAAASGAEQQQQRTQRTGGSSAVPPAVAALRQKQQSSHAASPPGSAVPAFIPLARVLSPGGAAGEAAIMGAQQQQQQQQQQQGRQQQGQQQQGRQQQQQQQPVAAELAEAQAAARAAAQRSSRPASASQQPSRSTPGAAAAPAAAVAERPRSASAESEPGGGGRGKRKRAAIQWQPQESQPGDAPLLSNASMPAEPPSKQPKAAAAGKAAAAAAAPGAAQPKAAASGKTAAAPGAKQPKAAAGAHKGKRADAALDPSSFTFTVRNLPPARESSPAESGELWPATAARGEGPAGGTSRLAVSSTNPDLLASPTAAAAAAHTWVQQQRQQRQQQPPYASGSGTFTVQAAPADDGGQALPPGFGGADSLAAAAAARGRSVGALPGDGAANLTVRVLVPPPAGSHDGGSYGTTMAAPTADYAQAGYMAPDAAMQQHYSAGMGFAAPQHALPAHLPQGLLPGGLPVAIDEFGNSYAHATDIIALQQQQLALQQQAQQVQQAQLSLPQQVGGYDPAEELPPGYGSGYAAASPADSAPLEPRGESGRKRQKSEGRRVELERCGSGGGDGGGRDRRGGGSGSGRSGSQDAWEHDKQNSGGRRGSKDACWDPLSVWESELVHQLGSQPKGFAVGELHRRHPLPPCMPQDEATFHRYLERRKQLRRMIKSQRGSDRSHDLVCPDPCAAAWMRYKRALLQLLADRRPRLEAEMVARNLPPADGLSAFLRAYLRKGFARFVRTFCAAEVAATEAAGKGGDRRCLLELRPFPREASASAGCPPLSPDFARACPDFAKHGCQYGAQCYYAHAPPRDFKG